MKRIRKMKKMGEKNMDSLIMKRKNIKIYDGLCKEQY